MVELRRTRLALIFGGCSAEHEVSVQSARNVIEAVDRARYEVLPIYIDRDGKWTTPPVTALTSATPVSQISVLRDETSAGVAFVPNSSRQLIPLPNGNPPVAVDVAFPLLHGPMGEDGTVQGLLKLAGVPFVGSDVLGSAVGMDKDVMRRLLAYAGLPVVKYLTLRAHDVPDFERVVTEVGLPSFVKPANMGSSVGVSKVRNESEFTSAVRTAFAFDTKVLIEQAIVGRELECGVLGGSDPRASAVGEIVTRSEFYTYEAKYVDQDGSEMVIPADLSDDIRRNVQALSVRAFKSLECYGLARVDFFLTSEERLIVNEVNTMPGFTTRSMFPLLWKESELSYSELIEELIELALKRSAETQQLSTRRG